jgi:hypothetical protein
MRSAVLAIAEGKRLNAAQSIAVRSAKWVIIAILIAVAGCSNDNSSGSATSTASPTVAPSGKVPYTFATVPPTPIPVNSSELSSLVWRFYHDIGETNAGGNKDLSSILTSEFLKRHSSTWARDYGFITNPNVTIPGVRGKAVDYTVDYDYVADNGVKLHWRRSGAWVAAHGFSGWQLDEDQWNAVHIVSISYPVGSTYSVHDQIYSDGRHVFDIPGLQETFSTTSNGWKLTLAPLAAPTPAVAETPMQYTPSGYGQQPANSQPAVAPDVPCEEVGVSDVYDDGAILELDDGRHLQVADYDTATSSVWVAPFDALICNGDWLINKDDNESVDLSP